MNARQITRFTATLALAVLLGAPLIFSQTSETAPSKPMQHGMMQGGQMQGDMPVRCKAMMEKKQQMMQKCKMMNSRLDELSAEMNTATGQAKIDAMAALLNELVAQRKSMHQNMMQMQEGMMSGMMGDMPKGSMSGMMHQKMMQQQEGDAPETGRSGK